ncbi:MAG: fumarylacetoacetate hydrolase family protein [Candidatus Puniceispirillaceae bacterium]
MGVWHDGAVFWNLPESVIVPAMLFDPAPVFALPVAGEEKVFPVNRIFCVGRNYAAHAAEMGNEVDRQTPFYFTISPANAALGGQVPYPAGTSDYHHEVELVVALGSGGADIPVDRAMALVYGYGVGLDMTRRDLQAIAKEKRRPWCISKDCENGALLSPLTKAADFGPLGNQRISLTKNQEVVQDSTLDLMVHSVPELIAHLSQFYHLQAGDIIMTGTPEGVGPVQKGDRLTGKVAGLAPIDVTFTERHGL